MILKPTVGNQPLLGHPSMKGLLGFWVMNEGGGGHVADLSGNGHHGTLALNTTWAAGPHGPCLYFDGSDRVTIPDPGWYDFPDGITIIGMVNPDAASASADAIVSTTDAYSITLRCRFDQSKIQFLYGDGVDQDYSSMAPLTVPTSQWSHWTYTYDNAGGHECFFDGESVGTDSQDSDPVDTQGNDLWIGDLWEGYISWIMVYDHVLTHGEIMNLHRRPFQMFPSMPVELWSAATQGGGAPAGVAPTGNLYGPLGGPLRGVA